MEDAGKSRPSAPLGKVTAAFLPSAAKKNSARPLDYNSNNLSCTNPQHQGREYTVRHGCISKKTKARGIPQKVRCCELRRIWRRLPRLSGPEAASEEILPATRSCESIFRPCVALVCFILLYILFGTPQLEDSGLTGCLFALCIAPSPQHIWTGAHISRPSRTPTPRRPTSPAQGNC